MRFAAACACLCLAAAGVVASANAGEAAASPEATSQALRKLMAMSSRAIPAGSSCQGTYGQQGPATVADLLASQLAYFGAGANTVEGSCTASGCTVDIRRSNGEDVSSATITFGLKGGMPQARSLRCLMTP